MGLTEIVIPNSVKEIQAAAFASNKLISITIGSGVEYIGESYNDEPFDYEEPFYNNPTLTSIKVDENNKVYDSRDNSNAIIETSTNTLIQGCKNTVIPNTVTAIGDFAFYTMGLTKIKIPDSVKTIGGYAFSDNNLTSLTLGNSVEEIGYRAFAYNELTSVVIPNSVTSIGDSAFYNNNLTEIVIPDSVTKIGDYSFASNKLVSITIGSGVEYMGWIYNDQPFDYEEPFYNNPTLTSIKVDEANTTYDSRDNSNAIIETSTNTLIQGCKNTIIPNTVTKIGDNSFNGMGLTEIEIPDSVEEIGTRSFYSYSFSNPNLTTIYNQTGKAFDWNNIINVSDDDSEFITGTVTTSDNRVVTITTK